MPMDSLRKMASMTAGRNVDIDRENTASLLDDINTGKYVTVSDTSWLDHSAGAAQVDFELLWGTTMPRMQLLRGAVNEHFLHLEIEHGLTVLEKNGVYRLVVTPRG